jgi:Tol biopolymer transport system component
MKRWALAAAMICAAANGCGGSSLATVAPLTPLAAPTLVRPQLAMVRIRSAESPKEPLSDLILVTLGTKRDVVLSAGTHKGQLEPLTGPPAWSPNGRQLAFARITSGQLRGPHGYPYQHTDIYVVNADGSGLHRLTKTNDAIEPVWSPDGREIAFARDHLSQTSVSLTASIWTIHPNGSDPRQLTSTIDGQENLPASFSPDGRLLAFTRATPSPPVGLINGAQNGVYLLDTTHGTVRELASGAKDPVFSPNGHWVALSSTRARNGTRQAGEDSQAYAAELYLVDLTGEHWRRLTYTRGIDEDLPTFSPDGKRIAYVRVDAIQTRQVTDSYHHTIFEINLDGSCPTAIRDDRTAADRFGYYAPAWRPGRSARGAGPLHCARGD